MTQLSRMLLNDNVVEVLRARIYEGEYQPGTRLLQEELAEELGVSRTPLREAFRTLRHEGLIEESSQGVRVISLDIENVTQAYRLREVLDGLASRLAAERGDSWLRDKLDEELAIQEKAVSAGEFRSYTEANVGFHMAIWQAAGNEFVLAEGHILRMTAQLFVPRAVIPPAVAKLAVEGHHEIANAICGRDADRSELLAREHIRHTIDALISSRPDSASQFPESEVPPNEEKKK